MESLNLKVLPFAFAALIFSFLTFNTATRLISSFEILLDITQVISFLVQLALYTSLTTLSISLVLSQLQRIYFRMGLFFLILLPYISVFILKYLVDPLTALAILVLFAAMVFSILMEFNHLYANQIKTRIETPSRANARTITFFIGLVTAITFFAINNNPVSQEEISNKLLDQLTQSIAVAIEDYNLVEALSGQVGTSQLTQTSLGQQAIRQAQPQINTLVTNQIVSMVTPYLPYVIYIITLLIFATIAGASTLIGIFTTIIGYLLVKLLKAVGYLVEVKQTVEVTRLTL